MRWYNERRTVTLGGRRGAGEATVRVRGLDARAAGRGLVVQRLEPEEFAVDRGGMRRRYRIEAAPTGPPPLLYALGPLMYLLFRSGLRRKGGR